METGLIFLDRPIFTTLAYPADYGIVPQTLSEDGSPFDIIVLTTQGTFSGCVVIVRPVGLLKMKDEDGIDWKTLAVPKSDPRFDEVRDIADIPEHIKKEIAHFFEHIKDLESGKWASIEGWDGREAARKTLTDAAERYRSFGGKAR